MLQIYVGYHPQADVSWLGSAAEMASAASDIPYRVRSQHQWDVPKQAAATLLAVANLVRSGQSPDDLIEEMKSTKRLVLIEERRDGYLDGRSINVNEDVNWYGSSNLQWEMLWTLAEQAQLRRNVDTHSLRNSHASEAGEPLTSQAIKDRRSKLRQLIVPELNDLIDSKGRSTYRLNLQPDEICLLHWFSEDRLEVLTSSLPRHDRQSPVSGYLEPVRVALTGMRS